MIRERVPQFLPSTSNPCLRKRFRDHGARPRGRRGRLSTLPGRGDVGGPELCSSGRRATLRFHCASALVCNDTSGTDSQCRSGGCAVLRAASPRRQRSCAAPSSPAPLTCARPCPVPRWRPCPSTGSSSARRMRSSAASCCTRRVDRCAPALVVRAGAAHPRSPAPITTHYASPSPTAAGGQAARGREGRAGHPPPRAAGCRRRFRCGCHPAVRVGPLTAACAARSATRLRAGCLLAPCTC